MSHCPYCGEICVPVTKRIHTCGICGSEGEWTNDHVWYGSLKAEDDEREQLTVMCSDACYRKFQDSQVEAEIEAVKQKYQH